MLAAVEAVEVPAVRCIFCGSGLTKAELSAIGDADRFLKVLSLHTKILHRADRPLNSYAAHATEAQSALALGDGWHKVACFSHTEYLRSQVRTVGVLNGKLYWDDFDHMDSKCDDAHRLLTTGEINHILGITPEKRRHISAKTRRLVFEQNGGRCDRCGEINEIELHRRLPVIHGGTNDPDNLVPLCHNCRTYHSDEFTEHVWPDLEAIFLACEGSPGQALSARGRP
jgi:hypothetical protein